MSVEVSIDPDLCIGSGDCVRSVPAAFRLDDAEGISRPTPDAPTIEIEELVDAARNCPTQAIRIVRGGVVLHGPNAGPPARTGLR